VAQQKSALSEGEPTETTLTYTPTYTPRARVPFCVPTGTAIVAPERRVEWAVVVSAGSQWPRVGSDPGVLLASAMWVNRDPRENSGVIYYRGLG
jgi:hypothetical protein